MSIFTDWLIAADTDASAIASIITTEEHSYEDWPALCIEGIGDLELQHLAPLLPGCSIDPALLLGDLLYQASDEGPFVAPVHPEFIRALASLPDHNLGSVAAAWRNSEHLREWPVAEVQSTLAGMVAFAREAERSQMPVLQLMTL